MPLVQTFANASARGWGEFLPSGAANSYELISTTLIASNTTTVSFPSIPQTYKHLQVRFTAKSTSGTNDSWVRVQGSFNSNTTDSNYAIHQLYGTGASVSAYAETSSRKGFGIATRSTNTVFAANVVDILDYTSTSKNTTVRALFGEVGSTTTTSITTGLLTELWMNTAAVTQIDLTTEDGSSFISGCRFSLYGLKG